MSAARFGAAQVADFVWKGDVYFWTGSVHKRGNSRSVLYVYGANFSVHLHRSFIQ